jgi:hypothetical protein
MAFVHQTLPPGAYIFEVTQWLKEKQTRGGSHYMVFEVRLLGTNRIEHMSISEEGGWRELMESPYEWLGFRYALNGRQFVVNVQRTQFSPSDQESYGNSLSTPICEVLPNPQEVSDGQDLAEGPR